MGLRGLSLVVLLIAACGGGGSAAEDPDGGAPVEDGGLLGEPCECDVTSLCDEGCDCDVACTAEAGDPPVGDDSVLSNRAEVAFLFAASDSGPIDRVVVRDDAWEPDPESSLGEAVTPPPSPYALLSDDAHDELEAPPAAVGADADGDGRDELVLATATELVVEDWSGSGLSARTVAAWDAADRTDVAVGDLDGDGAPETVVLEITGGTATLTAWSVPEDEGDAAEVASATRAGVDRGALAIGDTDADGTREVVLAYAEETTGTDRRIFTDRYVLDGSDLGSMGALDTGRGCAGAAEDIADEGGDVFAANLDDDPSDEVVFGFACGDDGDVAVTLVDFDAAEGEEVRGAWTAGGPGPLPREGLPLVPAIAPLKILAPGEQPGEPTPGRMAVAWTAEGPGGHPEARVAVLEYHPDDGTPLQHRDDGRVPNQQADAALVTGLAVDDVNLDGFDEVLLAVSDLQVAEDDPSCNPLADCMVFRSEASVLWNLDPYGGLGFLDDDELYREAYPPPGGAWEPPGPGPVAVLGDFDGDGLRVRRTGEVLLRAGRPHVNAVLAAPPTWLGTDGIAQAGGSATSFGTSETTGMSESQQIGASASTTVSAEGGFMDIVEVRGSITVSTEYVMGTSRETSVSIGGETSTGPDSNMVVYRVTPYASHVYEVVSHPDPEVRGQHMTIDVPGRSVETARTPEAFYDEHGEYGMATVPPALFGHEIGDPASYRDPNDCSEAALDALLGDAGDAFDVFRGEVVDVGSSPSGSTSRHVSFAEQTSMSTELSLGVEISSGVMAAGVGLDVTAGVSTTWTHETTIGSDVTYTGEVAHIAPDDHDIESEYAWALCVFHFRSADGQASYPVVGYSVERLL